MKSNKKESHGKALLRFTMPLPDGFPALRVKEIHRLVMDHNGSVGHVLILLGRMSTADKDEAKTMYCLHRCTGSFKPDDECLVACNVVCTDGMPVGMPGRHTTHWSMMDKHEEMCNE